MVLGPNEQPTLANASIVNTKQTAKVPKSKQRLNAEASLSRMESKKSLLALLQKLKPMEFVSTVTTMQIYGVQPPAKTFAANLSTVAKKV